MPVPESKEKKAEEPYFAPIKILTPRPASVPEEKKEDPKSKEFPGFLGSTSGISSTIPEPEPAPEPKTDSMEEPTSKPTVPSWIETAAPTPKATIAPKNEVEKIKDKVIKPPV